MKVGLGLIGLGYVGRTHLRNCFKINDAEVVAVSDISKRALKLAENMGVKKSFKDYGQLLKDSQIDAVIISLPTFLHANCAQEAAEAGKDIFLEKPLARNETEGNEIVSTSRKFGVKLMVGYPFRFVSTFSSLRDKISTGVLGDIQTAYASFIGEGPFVHRGSRIPHPVPSWWFKKEFVGGGSLIDQGCHLVNLLRWYFGEVKEATCYLGYRFNLDVEDHAVCVLKFSSGETAIINVGWYSMKTQIRVEVLGTFQHATVDHRPSSKIVTGLQMLAGLTPRFSMPYFLELEHFVNCVRQDLLPSPSGKDALKDIETISLAYKNSMQLADLAKSAGEIG